MGSACSNKSATEIEYSGFHTILRSRSMNDREKQLKIRKGLLFQSEEGESTFLRLSTPRNGQVIRWRRGGLIGEGAHGQVFQCLNMKNGELMAVKHFDLSDDPKQIEKVFLSMKKEISLLTVLSHPNIVQYYQTDLAEDMKSIDVLLEFVPGGSLKTLLDKYGALEPEVIRSYALQLLKGLDYLHENNIVHRDLKSANILIAMNGGLKLSDFGSSRKFEELDTCLSKSLRGSPYWMAPEVVSRSGHSFSADIWSFGCVLIEMGTGRPPWSNFSRDTMQVLEMIFKTNSLPDIPSQDKELEKIIRLCLNRNPDLRPSTKKLLLLNYFDLEYLYI